MKHIKFTIEMDDRLGDYGAMPNIFKSWDSYIASWGLGHDLIEHSTKSGMETGEIYQELRALGAHVFTSCFGGYRKQTIFFNCTPKSLGEEFGSNLEGILSDQENGWGKLPKAPRVKLEDYEIEQFDELWKGMKYYVRTHGRSEWDEGDVLRFYWENKGEILAWLKYGFYLAKKRYEGDDWSAWHMRSTIDKTLTQFSQTIDPELAEGREFTLCFDVPSGHCEVRENYRFGW